MGTHCLRTYSVTQKAVSLSSAEAELMALVKATSEAIGIQQLAASWDLQLDIGVHVDSSAALSVTARKGNGKLRHVRIGHLWVQELAEAEVVRFRKVHGASNPADLMTKHLAGQRSAELAPALDQTPREGHVDCRIALTALGKAPPPGEARASGARQEVSFVPIPRCPRGQKKLGVYSR